MTTRRNFGLNAILLASVGWTAALVWTVSAASTSPVGATFRSPVPQTAQAPTPMSPVKASMETSDEAVAASAGCITCHTKTDEASMHPSGTVTLGCATCHGGDPKVYVAPGAAPPAARGPAAPRGGDPPPRG